MPFVVLVISFLDAATLELIESRQAFIAIKKKQQQICKEKNYYNNNIIV